MTTFALPACLGCQRLHRNTDIPFSETCDAYPDGIPGPILAGEPHDKPRKGDHGLQFLPIEPTP